MTGIHDILDEPRFYGTPAVVLENPKFPHNVGAALRACSCFGATSLYFTGKRITDALSLEKRLPREERMKGYRSVKLVKHEYPLLLFPNSPRTKVVPVCVELVPMAVPLSQFQHPDNAVYIFGPEDGSISKGVRKVCHQFIFIPSKHCLNLAAAVYVVLYDRMVKSGVDLRLAEERGYCG